MSNEIVCDTDFGSSTCNSCEHPCVTYLFFDTNPECVYCAELSTKCVDAPCSQQQHKRGVTR